jgi:hypothetical protein
MNVRMPVRSILPLVFGVAGLGVAWAMLAVAHDAAFSGYLVAYVFWFGVSAGALALRLLHVLAGGSWGEALLPVLRAASEAMPLLVLLFVPLLFGLSALYPWARSDPSTAMLPAQRWYLNTSFFVARTVVCFALWLALAWRLAAAPRTALASTGAIIYAVIATVAAVDWLMSLQPLWRSSVFGMSFIVAQMLTAFAFAVLVRASYLRRPGDAGMMLMMFVLAAAYLLLMEYLTAWSANLPAEIVWYQPRTQTGWKVLALLFVVLEFTIPFFALLPHAMRGAARVLRAISVFLLCGALLNDAWLVLPAFPNAHIASIVATAAATIGIGGLWMWAFQRRMRGLGSTTMEAVHG